ncbi:MAG: SRPBCC family protein [Bacteroidota bacterium]
MVDVLTEITIAQPLELVAAYAADPDNAPIWYDNIKEAEWKTEKSLNLGAQIAFKAKFLGRELAYVYEIVAYEPGQKLVMKTADGPFPMETTYVWTALGERETQMKLRNRGNPRGFSKIFAPMMARMMRKANVKDLQKIKQILEARP